MDPESDLPAFRSGFVAIVGQTNVGKSTLLNQVLGETVAAVSRRPQTTRNRILGVLHREQVQAVLMDTPGLHTPNAELGERMMDVARGSAGDADVVLLVADATRSVSAWEEGVVERAGKRPVVLALNKVDKMEKPALLPRIERYSRLTDFASVHPISAKDGTGVAELVDAVVGLLPEGPAYFPPDMLTDVSERFLAAELIRAEVFERTGQELPYSSAVRIDSFEERSRKNDVVIEAAILVERESQKGMIVGKGGHKVREIGAAARLVLSERFGVPVHLRLRVETARRWTRDPRALDRLGYTRTGEPEASE